MKKYDLSDYKSRGFWLLQAALDEKTREQLIEQSDQGFLKEVEITFQVNNIELDFLTLAKKLEDRCSAYADQLMKDRIPNMINKIITTLIMLDDESSDLLDWLREKGYKNE